MVNGGLGAAYRAIRPQAGAAATHALAIFQSFQKFIWLSFGYFFI
jgi:hypothetical protein